MAELLVRAKLHWKDSWNTEKINSLSKKEAEDYNARSQIGDIIVVKPNGWKWGREECLPHFVVIKLSNVKVKDVNHYEQSLMDDTDPHKLIMLKHRKYAIDASIVEECEKEIGGTKEIDKAIFDSKLITKAK